LGTKHMYEAKKKIKKERCLEVQKCEENGRVLSRGRGARSVSNVGQKVTRRADGGNGTFVSGKVFLLLYLRTGLKIKTRRKRDGVPSGEGKGRCEGKKTNSGDFREKLIGGAPKGDDPQKRAVRWQMRGFGEKRDTGYKKPGQWGRETGLKKLNTDRS